ncbi:MAG: redoxin domain-containing protein [Campylobacterales bacterium]|nr:redoxin domain-containing protein [Campylobacterales bacterium]
MRSKLLHYTKEVLLFLLFITILSNALSIYKSQDINKNNLPNIETKLINNQPYLPQENTPLIVHIWATWCPTCKIEIDNIERIAKHYNTITIAVNSGSNYEIKRFLDENNIHLDVVNDKEGTFAKLFNVNAYPTTLIYNKKRELVFSEVGYTSSFGLFLRVWWASL